MLKGAFSNNTLSLTKAGGGSVDIPFEGVDSEPYLVFADRSLTINLSQSNPNYSFEKIDGEDFDILPTVYPYDIISSSRRYMTSNQLYNVSATLGNRGFLSHIVSLTPASPSALNVDFLKITGNIPTPTGATFIRYRGFGHWIGTLYAAVNHGSTTTDLQYVSKIGSFELDISSSEKTITMSITSDTIYMCGYTGTQYQLVFFSSLTEISLI